VSDLFRVRGTIESKIREVDSSLVMVGRERAAALTGQTDAVHELAVILERPDLEKAIIPLINDMLPT
ncbi:MAG: ABC transporter permease, partial [Desulfuromonadales bacterium]|nr:ABC transporter permease [Desulfuromonadales bacterium]NIS40088.1 ABC transporter permease [Desulfuromonadales bacterium]